MKILSVKEGERNIALVLKDGWIMNSFSKGFLFQCSKEIIDISQTRRGVDLAQSFEIQYFQKELFEHPGFQECHQR